MGLFRRLLMGHASAAVVMVFVLIVSPAALTLPPSWEEMAWIIAALALLVGLSALAIHVALRPLAELREAMESVDTSLQVVHVGVVRQDEVGRLASSYNAMVDRLRHERARSATQALAAQEGERLRISRELHDEVGQTLTAVLLTLGQAGTDAEPAARTLVEQAQEAVRGALTEVRAISARLRPGVLDDLGLLPALTSLATQTAANGALTVARDLSDVGDLTHDQDLAIYRICQESLTNVVRHAAATHVSVTLRRAGDGVELLVDDDGVGVSSPSGTGRQGMRERALLVGGDLTVGARPAGAGGTRVRLWIPVPRRT